MYTTNLRKVGGSTMLALPPVFLDQLQLNVGASVGLAIEAGNLLVKPNPQPRYTLAELLAASDYSQVPSAKGREWLEAPAVGREL